MRIEKTVFISYRRTNIYHALAVYQHLTAGGFDAFIDYQSIDSGAFDQIILNQIAARAHFIVILTPSALERCADPGDWLRREIEHALDLKRNIVPLMFDQFDFAPVKQYLTGKLEVLSTYNGLAVPPGYFEEAMQRLISRYLNVPLAAVLHPTPPQDRAAVQQSKAEADAKPAPSEAQMSAEQYYERGNKLYNRSHFDQAIVYYTEAIHLAPDFASYHSRGHAQEKQGDYAAAVADYTEAIRLKSDNGYTYYCRGRAQSNLGNYGETIVDCTEAIHLDPDNAFAYVLRGNARAGQGNYDGAIADYLVALRIKPDFQIAKENLERARQQKRDQSK